MAVLAAITLIIGVYPNPFLNPITGYIQGIFANTPEVLPLPTGRTQRKYSGGMQNHKNIIPTTHEFGNNVQIVIILGIIKIASTSKGAY